MAVWAGPTTERLPEDMLVTRISSSPVALARSI
jgi:hypothetical protein